MQIKCRLQICEIKIIHMFIHLSSKVYEYFVRISTLDYVKVQDVLHAKG